MGHAGVAPLWPQMRILLPHNAPRPVTRSGIWRYDAIRPLVLRAGELTPVEKAERRVLFLVDPGRGPGAMQATSTIYVGLQLLLPGEAAPAHKHTPSAARIVVEGEGAFTVVDGEKLPMHPGDLILTPSGCWHDHGHDGKEPVIWLDALDLPLLVYLEGSYAIEAPLQKPRNRPDPSEVEYRAAGLLPPRRRDRPAPAFPMMRYPWARTEEALRKLAEHADSAVELDYVNPETGEVLPVDHGLHGHDVATKYNRTAGAAICKRCVPRHLGLRHVDDQRHSARLGPEGHVLRAALRRDRASSGRCGCRLPHSDPRRATTGKAWLLRRARAGLIKG